MSVLLNELTPNFCHVLAGILRHWLSNIYRLRSFRLGTHRLKLLTLLSIILHMSFVNMANAGNLSLLLNGKALHINPPRDIEYNERNWGAGLQYDFKSYGDTWIPFVTASGFLDSFENPSYYTGAGLVRRFHFGQEIDSLHFDTGIIGFFMTRKDYRNGNPFFGMLPALSFGNRRFALNITYIPKVQPKMVALWFFQLKISMTDF